MDTNPPLPTAPTPPDSVNVNLQMLGAKTWSWFIKNCSRTPNWWCGKGEHGENCGLFVRGHVTLLVGGSGKGKTTLMNQLAACAIRGDRFLGFDFPSGPAKILYQTEQPDSQLAKQGWLYGIEEGEGQRVWIITRPIVGKDFLKATMKGGGFDCLIVDTVQSMGARLTGVKDWIAEVEVSGMMEAYKEIARDLNVCVILLAQVTKEAYRGVTNTVDSMTAIKGSSVLYEQADCHLIFNPTSKEQGSLERYIRRGDKFREEEVVMELILSYEPASKVYTLTQAIKAGETSPRKPPISDPEQSDSGLLSIYRAGGAVKSQADIRKVVGKYYGSSVRADAAVDVMVERGFLSVEVGGRSKKSYTLTQAGREEVERLLASAPAPTASSQQSAPIPAFLVQFSNEPYSDPPSSQLPESGIEEWDGSL